MDTFKSSGGQHRNNRESAVRLKHIPTGIIAQITAQESCICLNSPPCSDSSQRNTVDLDAYSPPHELLQILPAKSSIKGQGVKALLDLIFAVEGSISEAAKFLGLRTGGGGSTVTVDPVRFS